MTKERQRQDTMTRRTFLASASITACIGMSAVGFPMASEQTQSGRVEDTPALLHAAVNLPSGGASIQTYALHRGRCTLVADTLCASVTALAMHPLLPVLYAAGDMVPGQSLPHGNIEVFQIDLNSSRLRSIARVAMSLSATGPRSLTVSPDGTYLLVASASGGIWNAFPLDANGIPAPTPIARKEIGSNAAHPGHAAAHPHSILYPANARFAIATDTGSNQISLIEPTAQEIAVHARYRAAPSAGPAQAAVCADRSCLLVANILVPSLSLWQIKGSPAAPSLQHVVTTPTPTPITALFATAPGTIAYSTRPEARGSSLDTWKLADLDKARVNVSGAKNPFSRIHTAILPFPSATALFHQSGQLWAATSEGILQLNMDSQGRLRQVSLNTPLPGLVSVALLHSRVC
jgi:hypothetical protein